MKNSMKRMLSAVMAITMVAGATSINAFAVEYDDNTTDEGAAQLVVDTTVEGTNEGIDLPVISVNVPTTAEIAINPYNLEGSGQIYSADHVIINKSIVPLTVAITGAKVEASDGMAISSTAPTAKDTDKKAMVSLTYTDGVGKATSTVLGTEGKDIVVATAMAPKGGRVVYNYTGAVTVNPTTAWDAAADTLTVSNAFKFTANTYATFPVTKAPTFWDKALVTTPTINVASDATESTINALLPASLSNGGKELPVTWTKDETAIAAGATVKYTASVTDEELYPVSSGVDMPVLSVVIAAAS